MPHPCARPIRLAVLLTAMLLGLSVAPAAAAPKAPETVQIRGTVYTFNDPNPIVGASVRVAELPGVVSTSDLDGTYRLEVPNGTRITPYVTAAGHHGIYLQTFVTAGKDIERANFQIPTDPIYSALAGLLEVPLDENGDPRDCAVVSTFSTAAVRNLSFADFVAFGAHGVAGATATTTPALPAPIYFNSSVIPDRSLSESSDDGGVIWLGVPKGVYRVRAHHPTEHFAQFVATCEPGRLINANPPQGLYQLRPGEKIDAHVDASPTSVQVRRSRGERVVRIETRASEYVAIAAELRAGGKRLGKSGGDGGPGAYDKGRRKTRIVVHHARDARHATLRIQFADAAGNEKVVRKDVRLGGI